MVTNIGRGLDLAVRAACPRILGISIGVIEDRSTWHAVFPSDAPGPTAQESAAIMAAILAFDPNDLAQALADLDTEVRQALDSERLISAVVWTILDQIAPPATPAKYAAARGKIIAAYKLQPWK